MRTPRVRSWAVRPAAGAGRPRSSQLEVLAPRPPAPPRRGPARQNESSLCVMYYTYLTTTSGTWCTCCAELG
eukprot:scaffold42438_cov90-Phaeocystis_antarctica.AAC.1